MFPAAIWEWLKLVYKLLPTDVILGNLNAIHSSDQGLDLILWEVRLEYRTMSLREHFARKPQ